MLTEDNNSFQVSQKVITASPSNAQQAKEAVENDPESKMFRVTYVVDQEEGPYKTIQAAIDEAKPNSTIKISSGLYKENLVITKSSLKIESKDFNPDVYIMGNKGPAVYIDIEDGGSCLIQNIRFVHKGGAAGKVHCGFDAPNLLAAGIKGLANNNEMILGLETYHKTFESVSFNSKKDSMIFVKKGGVILRGCLMTLNFIMKCNQDVLTMITLCKGTNSMIANCEIKGNLSFPTIGIVIDNATCIIKETVVDGFSKGGILMWLEDEHVCKIFASRVKNCKNVGIQIMGNS